MWDFFLLMVVLVRCLFLVWLFVCLCVSLLFVRRNLEADKHSYTANILFNLRTRKKKLAKRARSTRGAKRASGPHPLPSQVSGFALVSSYLQAGTKVGPDQLEFKNVTYYMASSASWQDGSNPALWLATRTGKMELSCPLGTTRRVPQEKFPRKPNN